MINKDLVIIGGGASGMMCAIAAADSYPEARIVILEKMEKCGRKIRITGKGRCNLTNNRQRDEFLERVRGGRELFEPAFEAFDNFYTMDFFENIGLPLTTLQGGRVFPRSEDAWDVVRALESACKELGVDIITNCEVRSIEQMESGFVVESSQGGIAAKRVVIATGGASYSATGSTGDGYRLAKSLGHTITELYPSLLPFEFSSTHLQELRGQVVKNISIALEIEGEVVAKEQGEIEFFGFGIGGGVTYRLSRAASYALTHNRKVVFVVDFKPSLSEAKLLGRAEREIADNAKLNIGGFVRKLFPQKLTSFILSEIGINRNILLSSLNIEQRKELIGVVKGVRLTITGSRGFAEAVITVGGVESTEIDSATMCSKVCEGLSIAGELLDIDADTGGYNLQIAFSTGYLAGRNALKGISNN